MNNLLILLGKRVHDLRTAKKWSQEEFAHVSGLHRTYVGQVERGEKNISFANLSKIAGVLGVTMSELLSGLEGGEQENGERRPRGRRTRSPLTGFKLRRLVRQLRIQQTAMERVTTLLEELTQSDDRKAPARQRGRSPSGSE